MNTQSIMEAVYSLLAQGETVLLIGALACCLLTGIVKKLSNKTAVDLTHKFDICVVAPFIFGLLIALGAAYFSNMRGIAAINYAIEKGIFMGALSTVMYRLWATMDKSNLKQLLKDDLFKLFYEQLMAFSDTASRLIKGELTAKELSVKYKRCAVTQERFIKNKGRTAKSNWLN